MKKPEIPLDERKRLQALNSYHILDTLPEKDYDALVEIAAIICDTPIAMISLIDKNRQFFKSMKGVDVRENSRDISICAHAINKPLELLEIPDTRLDERFADNPGVTGKPHIIFYAGMPLVTPDGAALGTLCVIDNKPRQLTILQKQALENLSNQVVHLLELRKKNELLLHTQKQLELHAGEMEDFAYVASHDLKEPLRIIYQFMNKLSNKYSEQLDDNAKKYIHYAEDGARRMTVLIDDLLIYATTGSRETTKEVVNFKELVDEVVLLQAAVLEEKDVRLTYGQLPVVYGFRTTLKLLFQNLLSNALKYQSENNKPVVSIAAADKGDHWQIEVKDNGIGIDISSDALSIFRPFKRLHSRAEYSGTGLGLAICKKITELHQGKIWVESEVGTGSSFYFTLKK